MSQYHGIVHHIRLDVLMRYASLVISLCLCRTVGTQADSMGHLPVRGKLAEDVRFLNSYSCILKHRLYFGSHMRLLQTQPRWVACPATLCGPGGEVSGRWLKAPPVPEEHPFDPEESSRRPGLWGA